MSSYSFISINPTTQDWEVGKDTSRKLNERTREYLLEKVPMNQRPWICYTESSLSYQ